jgi:hypothetical protein
MPRPGAVPTVSRPESSPRPLVAGPPRPRSSSSEERDSFLDDAIPSVPPGYAVLVPHDYYHPALTGAFGSLGVKSTEALRYCLPQFLVLRRFIVAFSKDAP